MCKSPSQSLFHSPEALLGYLFDISECEVTLFMCNVVWHDISCICKSWLSAAPDYRN